MNRVEEYRHNEAQCRRMWEATKNPKDKADWLKLANSWQAMLDDEERRSAGCLKEACGD